MYVCVLVLFLLLGRPESGKFPSLGLALLAREEFRQETKLYSGSEIASLFIKHARAQTCKQTPSYSGCPT